MDQPRRRHLEQQVHVAAFGPQLQLDRPTTLLADMNGDRLLDLVHIAPGTLHYYPAVGFGEFGERVAMWHAPTRIVDPHVCSLPT